MERAGRRRGGTEEEVAFLLNDQLVITERAEATFRG